MSLTQTLERNAAWWAAHPNLRTFWPDPVSTNHTQWSLIRGTAASLAFTVVHWHHNIESSLRHNRKDGTGGPMVDSDRFFCREYAIFATRAWLIEAQTEMETYPPEHEHWHSYGHTSIASVIRELQVALDDFEFNDAQRKVAP